MAEEAEENLGTETIVPKTEEVVVITPEGTVEAEVDKLAISKEKLAEETVKDTVPLSVFLDLKKDLKELKQDLKEAKTSQKSNVASAGIEELVGKYPNVEPELLQDLISLAKTQAVRELDSKYSPILEKQKFKDEKENFDKAFNTVYNKALKDNPELPKNIDKELIKTLVLTPKYKSVKISDILTQIYPSVVTGKSASENVTATAGGDVETITNFDKITPEQKKLIMNDATARQKYFNWLDTQTGR